MTQDTENYALQVRYTLRAFTRALAVVTAPLGLTTAEFRLLRTLGESGGEGLTQADLATLAAMDRPYVSTLVRRLIERGLLRSGRNGVDRRRADIALTQEGRSVLGRLSRRLAEVNGEAAAGIDAESLRTFTAVMYRMQANLGRYQSWPDQE